MKSDESASAPSSLVPAVSLPFLSHELMPAMPTNVFDPTLEPFMVELAYTMYAPSSLVVSESRVNAPVLVVPPMAAPASLKNVLGLTVLTRVTWLVSASTFSTMSCLRVERVWEATAAALSLERAPSSDQMMSTRWPRVKRWQAKFDGSKRMLKYALVPVPVGPVLKATERVKQEPEAIAQRRYDSFCERYQ
jgi:hypothetical protein